MNIVPLQSQAVRQEDFIGGKETTGCRFLRHATSRGEEGAIMLLISHCAILIRFSAALAMVLGAGAQADEPAPLAPTEADIACASASVLNDAQFSQEPLNAALSARFLNGYLDALDASHLVFLQSDLDEFSWFRSDLARMTAVKGDTWPAHVIYSRFLTRLAGQVNWETNFLQTAGFSFKGDDCWQPDRLNLPRPRDLTAARALWREEVRADYLEEKLAGLPPPQIVSRLTRRYERRLKIMGQLSANEVLEIYLDAFARAFDPHSDYFGHEVAQEFTTELNLSLVGIGGSLVAQGGHWVVSDLVPGGSAARSGLLHPGDRILAVGQGNHEPEDVTDMPWWHLVNLIRGPKGSTVRLVIDPVGKSGSRAETVSLVREDIRLTYEYAKAALVELPRTNCATCRLGVINLPVFYEKSAPDNYGASADTARLVKRLEQEGIAGLILDLRRNSGGSLKEAIGIAGLFIPSGPVVQVRDASGHTEVERSPNPNALYRGPLVVLTSRISASASEIVAGALQDYGRALIVGDASTFGKGTVQSMVPLRNLLHVRGFGAVKVTIAKFYRPSGASTQLKGVVPDIVLPSETDIPRIGEAELPNALPWDTVPPASYTNFNEVRPWLPKLRQRTAARVAANPGFQLVREELAAATSATSESLSLNESVRRREIVQADRLASAINDFCAGEAARGPRSFDLSLTNLEAAELTSPSTKPTLPADQLAGNSPADDLELRETENILADYIQLLPPTLTEPSSCLPGHGVKTITGTKTAMTETAPGRPAPRSLHF